MDYSNSIKINGNLLEINVLEYDVWEIVVVDGNFMLSQYNGRGSTTGVTITTFPNMGDGLFGYIHFAVNNNHCFSGNINNAEGKGCNFIVSPKNVTLTGKGDTFTVNVVSDCDCAHSSTTTSSEISVTNDVITSNSEGSFENHEVIFTNCNGLTETVYVSQKPTQSVTHMLSVSPQYISLNGSNTSFTINVVSICNGKNDFTYEDGDGLSLNKSTSTISGSLSTEGTKTFTVKNDCGDSKQVTVTYSKSTEDEHYLCILSACSEDVECCKETQYDFITGKSLSTSYTISSSSNWYIYSFDSDKVNCSKSGNKIIVSLGNDRTETNSVKEIILKNREGDDAIIKYTIGSGLTVESGVTFTFEDGSKEISVTVGTDYTFTTCIYAYKTENGVKEQIKWSNKSSNFKTVDSFSGGSDNCLSVKFSATTATQNSSFRTYTIRLQEQETYSDIKINVTVDRSNQVIEDGYRIEITPESGEYNLTDAHEFTVTVTPTYTYDGYEYFMGDNDVMMTTANTSYQGVSAKTTFYPNSVSAITSETNYDSIIYSISIPDNVSVISACTSAITKNGSETTATTCAEYTFTSTTEETICLFQTDASVVEVGYEATSVTYSFVSQNNFECVEYEWTQSELDWLTIDDSDCENIKFSFSENETLDDRETKLTFTQKGNNKCSNDSIEITFKQYSDGTVFIPAFDYLVIRYFWTANDGDDLDTVTVVSSMIKKDGESINVSSSTYPYISDGVGFGQGSSAVTDGNTAITDGSNVYIAHAGDNTDDGNECVYLNFKNLTSEDALRQMIADDIMKIRIDLYGTWYSSRGNGMLDTSLIAYLGGEISKDPNDTYNFINSGGEEVYNSTERAKVCATVKGSTNYSTEYTHIGYVEYDIQTKSAILKLNEECVESVYELSKTEATTSLTVTYEASTTNSITFNSTKDGNSFPDVTFTEACDFISDFTTTSTTSPYKYTYTLTENTTDSERLCGITVKQAESNKTIVYQIRQQANAATYFSLSETEEQREQHITLTEGQTTIRLNVLSCKNYNSASGTGNRLDYNATFSPCGSSGDKTEEGDYKYNHTFNIPTSCGSGSITLTQNETNAQITVTFSRECSCATQETVNVTASLEVKTQADGNKLYEVNGTYYIDVICNVTLDKVIECGTATVRIEYGLGTIDNAGFSDVFIENGTSSGTTTIQCSCGIVSEYDENQAMDCIHSTRDSHTITFTDNDCFVGGMFNVSVDTDSLCTDCTCDVTTVEVSPTYYKFTTEGEEKIFNLKIETDSCNLCTKGYKLYDPNGTLVTAGTGENTAKLTFATAINGNYTLIADDDNTKTATLQIEKFSSYCLMEIGEKPSQNEAASNYSSAITLSYPADTTDVYKYISTRSRYYTGETEYDLIGFTGSSDSTSWLTVLNNNNGFSWTVNHNNTYSSRTGKITLTQTGGTCSKQVYMIINQEGLPTSYELSASGTTIEPPAVEAYVYVKSLKNGESYSELSFAESCSWVTGYYRQSVSNGIYTYQFTTEPNTATTERSCTVTVSQTNGKNTTFTITQKAANNPNDYYFSFSENSLVTSTSITVNYPTSDVFDIPVYSCYGTDYNSGTAATYTFTSNPSLNWSDMTTNACEQGQIFSIVDGLGTLIGNSGTVNFTQTNSGKELELIWNIGETPNMSGFKIQNNQPGEATIQMKNNSGEIIPLSDSNGIPQQTITLNNGGTEQTFQAEFSSTTYVNITYSSGKWSNNSSSFLAATFIGTNLEPIPTAENNVDITDLSVDGFYIYAKGDSSCSGTITCRSGNYYVYVNFIFEGYPQ